VKAYRKLGASRKWLAGFLCLLFVGLASLSGLAAHIPVDLTRLNSVRVLTTGDHGEYGEDVARANVQVDLYFVA